MYSKCRRRHQLKGDSANGQWPAGVSTRELKVEEGPDESTVIHLADKRQTVIRLTRAGSGDPVFAEMLAGSKVIMTNTLISDVGMPGFSKAYEADLNLDGRPDYVIAFSCGGNGDSASLEILTFFLSAGEQYVVRSSEAYEFEPRDLIVCNGKPGFIYAEMHQVELCKDGKPHSFWVYQLLTFEGNMLRPDNSGVPGFPKIIWYTYDPNSKETQFRTYSSSINTGCPGMAGRGSCVPDRSKPLKKPAPRLRNCR